MGDEMASYDFDSTLQSLFEKKYGYFPLIDWRSWLSLPSIEAYETLATELSGLSSVENLPDRMQHERTDPEALTVDVHTFVQFKKERTPRIFCHTSGTSGGKISDIKWYHFSDELVSRLWSPGMQAIFEASGLNSHSSAILFVPSRNKGDGITYMNDYPVVKLYSAEFSQRLAVSLIKPHSYVLDEFKQYSSIQTLAHVLSLEKVSVVSAPATVILGWAHRERLHKKLKKSLESGPEDAAIQPLLELISRKGLNRAVDIIQDRLSDLLSESTFIFSTSSLSPESWSLIRTFLHWKKGEERVTNLYVGSEVGPFAASISQDPDTRSHETMSVFPLTLPALHGPSGFTLLSEPRNLRGHLFISRMHDSHPLINIATGDVITLSHQDGLPSIGGVILRAPFPLKRKVSLLPQIAPSPRPLYVGGYFDLDGIELIDPQTLLNCLVNTCEVTPHSSLLMLKREQGWEMIISSSASPSSIISCLPSCPGGSSLHEAIQAHTLHLRTVEENPVQPADSRSDRLEKVRAGELPKGVLKRWPLYVVSKKI